VLGVVATVLQHLLPTITVQTEVIQYFHQLRLQVVAKVEVVVVMVQQAMEVLVAVEEMVQVEVVEV